MTWEFKCPDGWEVIHKWGEGYALRDRTGELRVLIDCEEKSDGQQWIHVSASRKKWAPSHADMCRVKKDFIGCDRYAYSIWPPVDRYVNIHPYCLHLWARIEGVGQVLPEFSAVIEGFGRSI